MKPIYKTLLASAFGLLLFSCASAPETAPSVEETTESTSSSISEETSSSLTSSDPSSSSEPEEEVMSFKVVPPNLWDVHGPEDVYRCLQKGSGPRFRFPSDVPIFLSDGTSVDLEDLGYQGYTVDAYGGEYDEDGQILVNPERFVVPQVPTTQIFYGPALTASFGESFYFSVSKASRTDRFYPWGDYKLDGKNHTAGAYILVGVKYIDGEPPHHIDLAAVLENEKGEQKSVAVWDYGPILSSN